MIGAYRKPDHDIQVSEVGDYHDDFDVVAADPGLGHFYFADVTRFRLARLSEF